MAKNNSKKKYAQIISATILLVLLVGLGIGVGRLRGRPPAFPIAGNPQIDYSGLDGQTILQILQQSHRVETENTTLGTVVLAIDGVKSSTNNFWIYYLNGQLGQSPPDQVITKGGDQIEWRYLKLEDVQKNQ